MVWSLPIGTPIYARAPILAVLGLAGCGEQSKPGDSAAQSDLKIVEQVQIDDNGAAVQAEADAKIDARAHVVLVWGRGWHPGVIGIVASARGDERKVIGAFHADQFKAAADVNPHRLGY